MKKDNKKALYESIMTSVAKEVKKVLNETTSVNDVESQLIENGDGIYFVYSDHLSCDAAYLYVIRNGKIIHQ